MIMQDRASSGHTILIAEDNEEQRSLLAAVLGSAGYRVLEAADGDEAVAIVRKEQPALVLMDVTMPRTSGWNAVRVLKGDPETSRVPIIVITGLAGSFDRDASIAAGADDHIAKPVAPRQLLEEVKKFLPR